MKRWMVFFVTLCMILAVIPGKAYAVEADQEAAPVLREDMITGDGITRAEWLHDLVVLFGMTVEEANYPDNYFSDLTAETAYYADIMTAVEFGLTDLAAGSELRPEDPLTREFAAHTLNFCLGFSYAGEEYSYSDAGDTAYPEDAQIALDRGWFAAVDGGFSPAAQVMEAELTAMLEDAQAVQASMAYEQPSSNYVFADWVVEVPQGTDVVIDGNRVTIQGYTGTIDAGDNFAVYVSDIAFVYLATSVSSWGDTMVITTSDAAEGALVSCEAAGSVAVDLSTFQGSQEEVVLYGEDGEVLTFEAARSITLKKDGVTVSRDITLATGVTGKIWCDISSVTLDHKFDTWNQDYWFTVDGNMDCNAQVKVDLSAFTGDEAKVSLPLGSVSIAGVGTLSLSIDISLDGQLTYTYNTDFSVGAGYSDGSFRSILDFQKRSTTLTVEANCSSVLAATASVDLFIVDATAQASVGPKMYIKSVYYSEGTPAHCFTQQGYLYAGAYIDAGIVFIDQRYHESFDVFTQNNSPVRVYHHYEDGVAVLSCQRGSLPWVTPAYSQYSSSGLRSVGSTGYDEAGNQVPVWTYTVDSATGSATITGYQGSAAALIIPETIDGYTVTAIGEKAFYQKTALKMVSMPDTVTAVGTSAFQGCTGLMSIQFSDSLTAIDSYAFAGCTALAEADLPEGLLYLGGLTAPASGSGAAFSGCTALKSVYIPATLEYCVGNSTGGGNFAGCTNLTEVTFGEGTSQICAYMFKNCPGLTAIEIPDTVTMIGNCAFYGCTTLKSIVIPASVEKYGVSTFSGCSSLAEVTLSSNAPTIPESMFDGCSSLLRIELPAGVTAISDNTFKGCTKLETVVLPDTVTKLGAYAFNGCAALKDCSFLPPNVTSIGNYCFQGCTGMTEAVLPETVASIGTYAWQGCTALETVKMPDTVTSLGSYAFQKCTALTDVTLSKGLTTIGQYVFANCTSLQSIVIPKGVTTISDYAFYQDTKLTEITLPVTLTSISTNNAISYLPKMTVYGCAGTYAETWAAEKKCAAFIDITKAITSIDLPGGAETLLLGRSLTVVPELIYEPADTTDVITLTSSDTSIVAVGANLSLTGKKDGTATITAATSGGLTKTFEVTVSALSSIAVTAGPEKTNYVVGDPLDLTGLVVTATYANGGTQAVKDYTVTGFDGNTSGEQTVTVTYGGKTAAFTVTVAAEGVPVTEIALNKTETALTVGETETLTAVVAPDNATDKQISWTSSAPSVASVSSGGTITALSVGTATITAIAGDGTVTASCEVTVSAGTVAVTGVKLNTSTLNLVIGDTAVLSAAVEPADASNQKVIWTSTAPGVASVSEGTVRAVSAGTAMITVTTADGSYSARCQVTVALAVSAEEPAILVSAVQGWAGQTVDVTVGLQENPGIISMLLRVNYDSTVLTLKEVTDAGILGDTVHNTDLPQFPYTLSWTNDEATENLVVNGTIVTLTFEIAEDAKEGVYPIEVSYDNDNKEILDKDIQTVDFAVQNGSVAVTRSIHGDADRDGTVTSADRIVLSRYLADWEGYGPENLDLAAMDVNSDGNVTSVDRVILARHLAGWTGYKTLPYLP